MVEWRSATPDEIRHYYESEFPKYLAELPAHITPAGPHEYALAFRDDHPVGSLDSEIPPRDFIRRYTRADHDDGWGDPYFVDGSGEPSWDALLDFIRQPAANDPLHDAAPHLALVDPADADVSEPVPEAVYYSLMHHDRFWVLAFDIDAKDVAADALAETYSAADGRDDILAAAGVEAEPPEGYPYRFQDIERAIEYAFELAEFVREGLGKEEVVPVYSGQGAHLYVLDEDIRYTKQSREFIKTVVREHPDIQIPVDPLVTQDRSRVIRVPYSLHADVSRVVMPIDSPDFDFRTDAVPAFLEEA